jgi:hypothetical protein
MNRRTTTFSMIVAVLCALGVQLSAHASPDFRSVARLFGPGTMRGKAVYEERLHDATTEQRFKVELQNGIPGNSFNVRVNGTLMGAITINSLGRGKLQLRTAEFIDSPSDGSPIPDGFPQLDTSDIVTVGPLVGVFFDSLDTSEQVYRIGGDFGEDGSVSYKEQYDDGILEREFEVEIEHVAANRTFNVYARGKLIGTIRTNSLGRGHLTLRTPEFINDPSDGKPMPSTFPSLKAGDVVKVGSMSAVLG